MEKITLEHTFRKHKAPPLTNTVRLKRFNIIFKKIVVPINFNKIYYPRKG